MRNKKQAQPTQVYYQGTEAHQPSGIAPKKRLRARKTGTSVQFYYTLSITTKARDPLGFRGESDRA